MTYIVIEEPVSKGVCCDTLANSLKKQYYCEKCNYAFSKLCYLRLHMRFHAFVCFFCSKRFFYKSLLRRHISREHKITKKKQEESFTCEKCTNVFNSKYKYKIHLWMYHRDEYVCLRTFCQKKFKTREEYDYHIKDHELLPCDICGKKVKCHRSHILMHLKKKYSCRLCNKMFRQYPNLRRHMLIHLKIKPYTCSFCGKSFRQKYNMTIHQKIHTGEKLYKCKICFMSYIKSDALKLHEKAVHCGKEARKYTCDKCSFAAVTQWRVNEHKKLFHQELYQCGKCCMVLKCQKSLERHSWTHSKQKPFPCPTCIQQYATKAALTKHLKKFHTLE